MSVCVRACVFTSIRSFIFKRVPFYRHCFYKWRRSISQMNSMKRLLKRKFCMFSFFRLSLETTRMKVSPSWSIKAPKMICSQKICDELESTLSLIVEFVSMIQSVNYFTCKQSNSISFTSLGHVEYRLAGSSLFFAYGKHILFFFV